jgi:Cof subfamily protein (haloacid dehalogenase superfamily)
LVYSSDNPEYIGKEETISHNIKLLVLDIDGTLVNSAWVISENDRRALADARENGIMVSLCTGRAVKSCRHIHDSLALDGYHILFDGALIYNHKEDREIFSQYIPTKTITQVCEIALQDGIPLDLFSTTHLFVIEESWRTRIRRDFFKINSTVADLKIISQQEKIIKGSIVTGAPEDEREVRNFAAKFKNQLNFIWTVSPAFPDCHFININKAGVSKGTALEALITHLGLDKYEVAAIGDGLNDIPLLSTAGLAIAMGNSPSELKKIANYITDDVEHSGVAEAVRKFIL